MAAAQRAEAAQSGALEGEREQRRRTELGVLGAPVAGSIFLEPADEPVAAGPAVVANGSGQICLDLVGRRP